MYVPEGSGSIGLAVSTIDYIISGNKGRVRIQPSRLGEGMLWS